MSQSIDVASGVIFICGCLFIFGMGWLSRRMISEERVDGSYVLLIATIVGAGLIFVLAASVFLAKYMIVPIYK